MIKFVVKQNNNKKSSAFGKWYAYPVVEETIDLAKLARHMEEHNTGFSEAMCLGMMTAMVKCIKEQLLLGRNVKIDNLAIFSLGIKNKEGATSESEFSAISNIAGVKLRARATGTLSNTNLNIDASVRKASTVKTSGSASTDGKTDDSGNNPSGGGSSTPSGGGTTSGGGSSTEDKGGDSEEY